MKPHEWWQCRNCNRINHRDNLTTRSGVIECGPCLHNLQAVGLLRPVKNLKRYAVYRVRKGQGLVDFVTELEAPSQRLAEDRARYTESYDPLTEYLDVHEVTE